MDGIYLGGRLGDPYLQWCPRPSLRLVAAKVLSVSADNFKAQCSDKSVWDIAIQSKRTGFNPKGNWAASGASAAAFEASDEDL